MSCLRGFRERWFAGALLLALGGCAATGWPRGTWAKPDVEHEQRVRDEYECERRAITGKRPDVPPEVLYADCMRTKGYTRVK